MKRWIVVITSVITALVFFACMTTRAEAHPVPTIDGGHGFPDVFNATYVLTQAERTMEAGPCLETPAGGFAAVVFPCKNVDLAAHLSTGALGGGTNSDIWGWTDTACNPDREYAIIGMSESTVFVDVTIPEAPVVRGHIPFPRAAPGGTWPGTLWREVKVYNNHAYIVQDLVGSGVQIFDLTRLRGPLGCEGTPPVGFAFDSDEVYNQQGSGPTVSNVHTITINEATGFAYLNGSDTCNGGAPHMIDLKPDPKAPVFVGCMHDGGVPAGSDGYTHDAQCVYPYHGPDNDYNQPGNPREICVLYNEDSLTVYDATIKSAPVLLERQTYAGSAYTHQGWFTEDQRYILSDDELDEGTNETQNIPMKTFIWNASNLNNLVKINTFTHPKTRTADPNDRLVCIDHNQYVRGNLVYQSDYACGLRIYNLSDIATGTLNEVAYFDTMPLIELSVNIGGDIAGDWSNYPYFASGTVVVSNITEGLFVLQPRLGAPTAVKLASFSGRQTGRTVTLNWRTTIETDVLGFNVWRIAKNRRGIVNRVLIPAKGLGQAGGAKYRFVDRNARAGVVNTYKLQVVSKSGVRVFKASTTVRLQS